MIDGRGGGGRLWWTTASHVDVGGAEEQVRGQGWNPRTVTCRISAESFHLLTGYSEEFWDVNTEGLSVNGLHLSASEMVCQLRKLTPHPKKKKKKNLKAWQLIFDFENILTQCPHICFLLEPTATSHDLHQWICWPSCCYDWIVTTEQTAATHKGLKLQRKCSKWPLS